MTIRVMTLILFIILHNIINFHIKTRRIRIIQLVVLLARNDEQNDESDFVNQLIIECIFDCLIHSWNRILQSILRRNIF